MSRFDPEKVEWLGRYESDGTVAEQWVAMPTYRELYEAAEAMAEAIEAQIPGNSVVAREQRVLEALTAYREAGGE